MGFHRRYNGLQPPVIPGDPLSGPLPQQTMVGPISSASPAIFPPTPKQVETFMPTQPIRSFAPAMFDARTAASFLPVRPAESLPTMAAAVPPVQTYVDHPALRRAAESDDRAAQAAQTAKNAHAVAAAAEYDAGKARARADADPNAEADAIAARVRAAAAATDALRAAKAAAAADDKAQADADRANVDNGGINWGGSMPYDASGGNGPAEALAPTVSAGVSPQQNYLLAVLGGAGAGFLVGGPLGAVVGAGVGYALGNRRTRSSSAIAGYRYRRW